MAFRLPYPNLHLQRRDPDHYITTTSVSRPMAATSTTITLTSLKSKSDVRTVRLQLGMPQLVGRASKTKSKNLEAAEDNILFNCPVVSRRHAEIELQRIVGTEHVVIRDTGSMHGTRVNGVPLKGLDKTLREGDVIQLGEKVTNGEDAHEGVVLLVGFNDPNESQESHTLMETQASRGFTVPTYTDDEEDSDYASEDEVSDASQREEASSAKTTPEQRKAAPGTPEQPIDVDELAPRKVQVINPVEGTADERPLPQLPDISPSPRADPAPRRLSDEDLLMVVPETFDVNAKPILSQSARPLLVVQDHSVVNSDAEDRDHGDDEFLIGDETRFIEYSAASDGGSMGSRSAVSEDEEVEEEDDDEEEEEEEEEPEAYSLKQPREPSPELGTPDDFARFITSQQHPLDNALTSYGRDHDRSSSQWSNAADTAQSWGRQPHFDPIRSAQTYNDLYVTPKVHKATSSYHTRPKPKPSRWDILPAPSASYEPVRSLDPDPVFPAFSYHRQSSVNFDLEDRYFRPYSPVYMPAQDSPYELRPLEYVQPSESISMPRWPVSYSPPDDQMGSAGFGTSTGTTACEAQSPIQKAIPIANIIEPVQDDDRESNVKDSLATPKKIVKIKLPSTSSSAGKKRKADEMLQEFPRQQSLEVEVGTSVRDNASTAAASEVPQDDLIEGMQDLHEEIDVAGPPLAKKTRVGIAKIAGTAVAGLAAGSVATMAFLCSPLAEKAIEWLA